MRVAIADPPYPGQSKRLYGEHDAFAGEVDHRELVARLTSDFEAWALHTSASALHEILPLCPLPEPSRKNRGRFLQGTGTRVLIWCKPQVVWRPVSVQWGWEPILVHGARDRSARGFLRDYVFEALGLEPDDELHDLFPGSGAITAAWDAWRAQLPLVPQTNEEAVDAA